MNNRFYQTFDTTRLRPSTLKKDEHRSPFQIDRDRVIFSYAFRCLQSKTQVFQPGEYDFYRTRLTHSIEVARIGRSICDYLRVNDPHLEDAFFIDLDLTEAVGLAHDLGHPPFGHMGEKKLNLLMAPYGGFEGNAQTLRILTELIYQHDRQPYGMNPTRAFLDGVFKYKLCYSEKKALQQQTPRNQFFFDEQTPYRDFVFSGQEIPAEMRGQLPLNTFRSIECQIMDWADDAAYSLHDILDGIKAGFLTPERIGEWAASQSISATWEQPLKALIDVYKRKNMEAYFSIKMGTFVRACRLDPWENFMSPLTHRYCYRLHVEEAVKAECALYKKLAFDLIFESPEIRQVAFKRSHLIDKLFNAISEAYVESSQRGLEILPIAVAEWVKEATTVSERARKVCDYITGLTDRQAIQLYKRLFDPEFGSLFDPL